MKVNRRFLLVQHSSALDGSAHSGLLLAEGFRDAGWDTHVAFGFDGPIIHRYAKAGHRTHIVPHKNWLRRGRSHQFVKDVVLEWKKARAFEELIDDVGPDVIYLNTTVSLAGAVAAWRRDVPCVWHLREMFSDVGGEMHAPFWAVPLVRAMLRFYATKLVANSRATARNMLGKARSGGVAVVPNAIREAFFENDRTKKEARRTLGLPPGIPVIGVPGTLRPMKGHPFFLRGVAPLLRERKDVRVAITGGGESSYVAGLQAQVRDLEISDQIQFLEWVEDMPAFYRACDMVCIPSRAEPFGRTVIEAFASETPVVATAVGGIREIVQDDVTGLLVAYGDEGALGKKLEQLLDEPDLRRKISQRAHEVAVEAYHESVYKQRLVQLTQSMLAGNNQ